LGFLDVIVQIGIKVVNQNLKLVRGREKGRGKGKERKGEEKGREKGKGDVPILK
jgi:hypothetical protein